MEVKAGYKQTEIGVIPEDWDPVPLRTITSEIGDGIHTTPLYSTNGEYFFINGNNIRDGRIVVTEDTKVVDYSEFKKHKKNLGDRTIFLSINGTIGNLGLFSGEAVVLGKSAAYLNVKGEAGKKYVYYYLQTEPVRRQFNDGLTGTTIKNLGLATIRNTQIALPPTKAEQEAVAEALSDADALIESLEQFLAKKRHLKQGALQELLTAKKRLPGFSGDWVMKNLSNVGVVTMGQSPPGNSYSTNALGLPLLNGAADLTANGIKVSQYTNSPTRSSKRGDLLFCIRATIGNRQVADREYCLGRGVAALTVNAAFDPTFIGYQLDELFGVMSSQSEGGVIKGLRKDDVGAFQVRLPMEKAEQFAVATVLSDLDAEVTALEEKLTKARQLKQGMMQELLTGRIRLVEPRRVAGGARC